MTLDVETPHPPELNPTRDVTEYDDVDAGGGEYHREELEAFLKDGAWERAFNEWSDHTDLDESEFAVVDDLEMVREFDFFWDEFANRVGYHAPGLPENWREHELHPELDSWNTVSGINAAMAELGGIVASVLETEHVDWDSDPDVPEDLPEYD